MKLKIGTAKLQEMVSRSIKGAGNNKLIPLTSLMNVSLKKDKLTLVTTDATNYLYVSEKDVKGDDFSITVPIETFSKLIARMTCENIELELKDTCLQVKGNGKYSIELPLDENGELIAYPDPLSEVKLKKADEVNFTTIATILTSVRPSLSVTLEEPCYTGYYVQDKVIATDLCKMAWLDETVLKEPKLISADMMNLLSVMTAEKINVCIKDNVIVFYTDNVTVYGLAMEGIDDFEIDALTGLIDTKFESHCKLATGELLQYLTVCLCSLELMTKMLCC